jgi:hypothetical protein
MANQKLSERKARQGKSRYNVTVEHHPNPKHPDASDRIVTWSHGDGDRGGKLSARFCKNNAPEDTVQISFETWTKGLKGGLSSKHGSVCLTPDEAKLFVEALTGAIPAKAECA